MNQAHEPSPGLSGHPLPSDGRGAGGEGSSWRESEEARSRRRWRKFLLRACAALVLLWIAFQIALRLVPLPEGLFETHPGTLEIVDRHGRSLREVHPGERAVGRLGASDRLPATLVNATLAAEDKRFWKHGGVDWRASLRALASFVRNGRVISGGSTITQQLIKLSASQPRPRNLRTKLIEAIQAMRLEQVWDKQRILAEYLLRLDYGNLTTGPAEAARHYFGKPLRDLSMAEAAFLAGLPQSPTRLNPRVRFERAHRRQQWILARLEQNGLLTALERVRAAAEPMQLADGRRAFEAPHVVDLITSGLAGWNRRPSEILRTTIDLELNRVVERALRQQVNLLHHQNVRDAAAVIIENRTGDVLALVGSGNYFGLQAGQVNGAWAPRSAGSTLKPFTYLLAFEQGANPASIVDDLPTEFATSTGVFAPENYNRHNYGPVRYRKALANSLNISAVKVLQSAGGAAALQQRLQSLGLTTLTQPPEHYGLGLTIGNAEVRLIELANAYAALARLGQFRPWRLVCDGGERGSEEAGERGGEGVGERGGGNLELPVNRLTPPLPHSLPPELSCSPAPSAAAAAWLIADILADNNARSLAFGLDSSLRFDFPVACKTGTSSDFRDNWAMGYTPDFTVGVWMGNFDGTPMQGVSGVSGAAPVMHELFEHLHNRFGTTWFVTPTNIVEKIVHPVTGKILTHPRAGGVRERFHLLPPVESSDDYDDAGRVRLSSSYGDWLRSGDNWLGTNAVVVVRNASGMEKLRLLSPLPGTIFFMDPDLPQSSRAIPLRAEGGAGLEWHSDSLDCRSGPAGPVALMQEGRHRLSVLCRETGQRTETWVLVKGL